MTLKATEAQKAEFERDKGPATIERATGDPTVNFLLILGGAFVALRFFAAIWKSSLARGRFSKKPK